MANTAAGHRRARGHGRLRGAVADDEIGPHLRREPAGGRRRVRAARQRVGRRRRAGHRAVRGPDHRGRRPDHGHVPGRGLHAVARGSARRRSSPVPRWCCSRATCGTCRRPRRPCVTPPPPRTPANGSVALVALGPFLRPPAPARIPRPPARRRRHPLGQRGGGDDALRRQSPTRRPSTRPRRRACSSWSPGGPQGATVLTARGPEEVPAAPVERVVDTTGAGRPLRRRLPLRAHPRHGARGEHPARRAVRGGGHLPHRRPARGRPQGTRCRAPASWPGERRA